MIINKTGIFSLKSHNLKIKNLSGHHCMCHVFEQILQSLSSCVSLYMQIRSINIPKASNTTSPYLSALDFSHFLPTGLRSLE